MDNYHNDVRVWRAHEVQKRCVLNTSDGDNRMLDSVFQGPPPAGAFRVRGPPPPPPSNDPPASPRPPPGGPPGSVPTPTRLALALSASSSSGAAGPCNPAPTPNLMEGIKDLRRTMEQMATNVQTLLDKAAAAETTQRQVAELSQKVDAMLQQGTELHQKVDVVNAKLDDVKGKVEHVNHMLRHASGKIHEMEQIMSQWQRWSS